MKKMSRISWIFTALILSSGFLSSAGAQQTNDVPPTYRSAPEPRYQEPAPLPPSDPRTISPSPDATGPGWSPPGRLVVHNDNGVRYVSGGVGEGERDELNSQSQQFNLRLLFAMQDSGKYLSAVRVNILDTHGQTVLVAQSKGPWFLAQLAPGDYTVEVSVPDGQTEQQPQRQTAHINDSRQSRLNFYWR